MPHFLNWRLGHDDLLGTLQEPDCRKFQRGQERMGTAVRHVTLLRNVALKERVETEWWLMLS